MTDTRDEAVAKLNKRLRNPVWHNREVTELAFLNLEAMNEAADEIEQLYAERAKLDQALSALSRQLAEAQEARDLHAAALECYSKEQAIIRKDLAEAQGVIERYREALLAIQLDCASAARVHGDAAGRALEIASNFARSILSHTAAMGTKP